MKLKLLRRVAAAYLTVMMLTLATTLTGAAMVACTAAQWANFVAVSTQFATYVLAFLESVKGAWALILPLLGSAAPDADKVFQKAVVTAANAVQAMQDAVQAATLAQQPTLDLTALMAAVKDAVSALMTIYDQYAVSAPQYAATHDAVRVHARAIAAWR
jgi:hypothetical protein